MTGRTNRSRPAVPTSRAAAVAGRAPPRPPRAPAAGAPILDERGRVAFIVHRVEDVTEFVRAKDLSREHDRGSGKLNSRTAGMEADVYTRARDIADTNRELNVANLELRRSEAFL